MSVAGVQVYIHVPFCRAKCGYCAFYSESGAPAELHRACLAKPSKTVSLLAMQKEYRYS